MTYADYLASPQWQARREWTITAAGYRCQLCNASGPLDVHHRTYERLGHELPGDLIALCETCHERVHLFVLPPIPGATEADRNYRRRLAIVASVDAAFASVNSGPARAQSSGAIPAAEPITRPAGDACSDQRQASTRPAPVLIVERRDR